MKINYNRIINVNNINDDSYETAHETAEHINKLLSLDTRSCHVHNYNNLTAETVFRTNKKVINYSAQYETFSLEAFKRKKLFDYEKINSHVCSLKDKDTKYMALALFAKSYEDIEYFLKFNNINPSTINFEYLKENISVLTLLQEQLNNNNIDLNFLEEENKSIISNLSNDRCNAIIEKLQEFSLTIKEINQCNQVINTHIDNLEHQLIGDNLSLNDLLHKIRKYFVNSELDLNDEDILNIETILNRIIIYFNDLTNEKVKTKN